jgi:hypothetical protein
MMDMTVSETLTVLFDKFVNNLIEGLAAYGRGQIGEAYPFIEHEDNNNEIK